MSSGSLPPQLNSPFGHFSYLFPQQQPFNYHQQQQRFKIKRQRQRVDAGEPRNSYQQPKLPSMEPEAVNVLFPWMNQNIDNDYIKEEQPTDLSCKDQKTEGILKDPSVEVDLDPQLDVENTDDKNAASMAEDIPVSDTPVSNSSAHSSSSSSSKRKSFQPQKNLQDISAESTEFPDTEEPVSANNHESASIEDDELLEMANGETLSALQSQLSSPAMKYNDILETQRRMYASLMEQQKKMAQAQTADAEKQKQPQARDFSQLAQNLKSELVETMTQSIDKILKEWAAGEILRLQQQQQQQQQQDSARQSLQQNPMFNIFQQQNNPLAHFGMGAPGVPQNGIFPAAFNAFNPLLNGLNGLRRPFDDDGPKKKRSKFQSILKVTDSIRKLNGGTPYTKEGSPCSGKSTPQLSSSMNYFPPTMVPMYGAHSNSFGEREDSPTISDNDSDCGVYDGMGGHSQTLTPMHLRKAKLMFFFTRYPNSTLLKSYFPDIRFNKNNTAQLVKWFSNFREFYYIQMEKYARQALAEQVKSRDDIIVTTDSEIFKTLNQHYNRNNHIQPPEKLVMVVQESLREFFDAIRSQKDNEPSWKKTIYKVINRLDDHIPEYFKDPNFMDKLE